MSVITYLQMLDSKELIERDCADPEFRVKECLDEQWRVSKSFYRSVGKDWNWIDRLGWTDRQWMEYAQAKNLRTFVAYKAGSSAGYYELKKDEDGAVEIAFFGLLPAFIGKGYGRFLLSHAIGNAWQWGASRVWLHTCTEDHPHALDNYLKSGLKIYKREQRP
ncbi:MAG: GNAT family N-acetyltransferase [Phycisphaerales bacterium]|nr:MAG: GNAT family N-acetyltransferase [Phycisphaerales bacterium]